MYPKHRGDLLEAAVVVQRMRAGLIESSRFLRNPLDVLAQQIVAHVAMHPECTVEQLSAMVRGAACFAELSDDLLANVLDLLSGRYPSDEFNELRPRLVWDRVNHQLAALPGSRLLALTNGGTISDRGAFNAYLADGKTKLGELDEEFVYETRIGDTLLLGSQVWRVIDLTDDRVIVADAAGATPRMPFWLSLIHI